MLLFGTLALNLAVRPETLLLQNALLRYAVASVLIFAPVFLANVIFSNSFRDTDKADVAFASNLLGIMVGGMLEYLSMLSGYHMLLWLVIAFYAARDAAAKPRIGGHAIALSREARVGATHLCHSDRSEAEWRNLLQPSLHLL